MREARGNAWYREPWPWLLMSGPALAVIAGAATLWLAVKSDDGLVADDYYKQGLAINQALQRDTQARQRGLRAWLRFDAARGHIALRMAGVTEPELKLRLTHPTIPGRDQRLTLRARGTEEFSAAAHLPETGRWLITLEDEAMTWRLTGWWHAAVQRELELAPLADE